MCSQQWQLCSATPKPGKSPELVKASAASDLPLLPGAATASEMMALMAAGLTELKLFPTAVAGGIDYLRAVASSLADAVFCPTGGISAETATDWLALSNVTCVGGTWVAPEICLLPAILRPSPPAQKPASVCPADHNRSRNSTHIGAESA